MNSAEIILPWPDKTLSPNARVHWAKLAKAKKIAKTTAHALTLEAGIKDIGADRVSVRYTFHPPTRARMDADNLLARCKAVSDGIALAIGVDDSKWDLAISPLGEVVKGGAVKVELQWGNNNG